MWGNPGAFFIKLKARVGPVHLHGIGPGQSFEEIEKLKKAWQVYKSLPEKFKNVRVVEGEISVREVFSQIKKIVRSKLNL